MTFETLSGVYSSSSQRLQAITRELLAEDETWGLFWKRDSLLGQDKSSTQFDPEITSHALVLT